MDFEKYLDKAIELGTNAVNQHGQQAWETILTIQRLSSAQRLSLGIVGLLMCLATYILLRKAHKAAMLPVSPDFEEFLIPVRFIAAGILGVVGFFCAVELVVFWNWVGLFYPELAIAKQALDAVMK